MTGQLKALFDRIPITLDLGGFPREGPDRADTRQGFFRDFRGACQGVLDILAAAT